MCRRLIAVPIVTAFMAAVASSSGQAEVILEDRGIYKKERWNIQERYDDLDNPRDAPGIITSGQDSENPSGPALDFGEPVEEGANAEAED